MFIGHFGVGLAAKRIVPTVSLGTLFLSAQFLDLLWPIFLLLGWERAKIAPGNTAFTPLDFESFPISHSLLTVIGWSIGFGCVYYLLKRYPGGAIVVAIGVLSHWILDLIVQRPDLQLIPGNEMRVGLGLWNSIPGTLIVEVSLFLLGLVLYLRSTKAQDKTGVFAFWSLMIFLVLVYIGSSTGPPPPSEKALAWVALATWLLIPWGYWIDRHRESVK